jgi:hypothetical protein
MLNRTDFLSRGVPTSEQPADEPSPQDLPELNDSPIETNPIGQDMEDVWRAAESGIGDADVPRIGARDFPDGTDFADGSSSDGSPNAGTSTEDDPLDLTGDGEPYPVEEVSPID